MLEISLALRLIVDSHIHQVCDSRFVVVLCHCERSFILSVDILWMLGGIGLVSDSTRWAQ